MTARLPGHEPARDRVRSLRIVGAADRDPHDDSRATVSVAAGFGQLVTLRAIGETVALVSDFPLAAVADLRVALDEVATCLVGAAARNSRLDCAFDVDATAITVSLRAVVGTGDPLDEAGFSWHIVRTITDRLSVRTFPYDPVVAGRPVEVVFGRNRDSGSPGYRP